MGCCTTSFLAFVLTIPFFAICYEDTSNNQEIVYTRAIFLLNPNQRVLKIYKIDDLQQNIAELINDLKVFCPQIEPQHIRIQAPVLLIPNVIPPEICRSLINIWETQGHGDSGFMKRDGDKTVGYIDHNFKIRSDHFLQPGSTKTFIDRVLRQRIFPEIKKAFHYEVTRREDYKIACYDATTGGFFRPHRDNTTGGTAHRKFAMTLNLNADEYEGGYLRFPEHSPHLYKPDTGGAIIFSGALLHEATDVISGRRFALLCFLYGDKEAELRRDYESRVQNDYTKIVVRT